MTKELFGAGPLSSRYDAALKFASDVHRTQMRKSQQVPYLSHLLRVSGLALDYGATEEVAIAALLHDVVEDCGGMEALEKIRVAFGEKVAQFVLETSDSTASDSQKKAPWRERKEAYIERLKRCSPEAALISGCDKLDNVSSILRALKAREDWALLNKFKGGRTEQFWFWDSIVDVLKERNAPVAQELAVAVASLKKIWRDDVKY